MQAHCSILPCDRLGKLSCGFYVHALSFIVMFYSNAFLGFRHCVAFNRIRGGLPSAYLIPGELCVPVSVQGEEDLEVG